MGKSGPETSPATDSTERGPGNVADTDDAQGGLRVHANIRININGARRDGVRSHT